MAKNLYVHALAVLAQSQMESSHQIHHPKSRQPCPQAPPPEVRPGTHRLHLRQQFSHNFASCTYLVRMWKIILTKNTFK